MSCQFLCYVLRTVIHALSCVKLLNSGSISVCRSSSSNSTVPIVLTEEKVKPIVVLKRKRTLFELCVCVCSLAEEKVKPIASCWRETGPCLNCGVGVFRWSHRGKYLRFVRKLHRLSAGFFSCVYNRRQRPLWCQTLLSQLSEILWGDFISSHFHLFIF